MQISKMGLAAEYRIVARKVGMPGERVLADWFPNLITDTGLDSVATVNSWKAYCHVGTGTLAPATSDTALQTPVASTAARSNVVNTNAGAPSYYTQSSVDYTFPVGAGTYTEVGVSNKAHTDGAQLLFSRALIVDGGGNPTAITVLADEYLVVTYRIRIYPPLADVTGTISIGSDIYNYTVRAAQVTSVLWDRCLEGPGYIFQFSGNNGTFARCRCYSGALGAITGSPGGQIYDGTSGGTGASVNAYVLGSYELSWNILTPFSEANGAGYIRSIQLFSYSPSGTTRGLQSYQIEFSPTVPKTVNIQLTWTLGVGWNRYVAP